MNIRKYTRLFVVSCIPLLILGFITAKIFFPYDSNAMMTCETFLGIENCRSVGNVDGSFYKMVISEYPEWFDVQVGDYDKNSVFVGIRATARRVLNAEIMSAIPYTGYGPEVASSMGALAGRRVTVDLGNQNKEKSIAAGDMNILFCNTLKFESTQGEYTSACHGSGWGGRVTYQVTGASRGEFDKLLNSINIEIDSRRLDNYLYQIIMYPMFIYIFLVVSFLMWLFMKAVRFVNRA